MGEGLVLRCSRHGADGAAAGASVHGAGRTDGLSAAEVDERPGVGRRAPEDVAGLEVAVTQAGGVQQLQALCDVAQHKHRRHKVRRDAVHPLVEALAPLDHDERRQRPTRPVHDPRVGVVLHHNHHAWRLALFHPIQILWFRQFSAAVLVNIEAETAHVRHACMHTCMYPSRAAPARRRRPASSRAASGSCRAQARARRRGGR